MNCKSNNMYGSTGLTRGVVNYLTHTDTLYFIDVDILASNRQAKRIIQSTELLLKECQACQSYNATSIAHYMTATYQRVRLGLQDVLPIGHKSFIQGLTTENEIGQTTFT